MTKRKVRKSVVKIGLDAFDSLFHGCIDGKKMPESDYFFNHMFDDNAFYNYWSSDKVHECDDMLLLLDEVLSEERNKT